MEERVEGELPARRFFSPLQTSLPRRTLSQKREKPKLANLSNPLASKFLTVFFRHSQAKAVQRVNRPDRPRFLPSLLLLPSSPLCSSNHHPLHPETCSRNSSIDAPPRPRPPTPTPTRPTPTIVATLHQLRFERITPSTARLELPPFLLPPTLRQQRQLRAQEEEEEEG